MFTVARQGLRAHVRTIQSASDAAADASYARGLFFGVNNESQCFPYPTPSEDERDMIMSLVDPVQRYFENEVDSKKMDETKKIPDETMQALKDMGLFGLQIDEELDGLGLSNTGYARVCEEISVDASLAVTVMAHQSIGLKGILLNGNDAQKQQYLPKLATGEHMAAFALTEPSSGSDAQSITTRAVLSDDGESFLLSGGKIWISNGGWADVMTVFAQVEVDGVDKVTAFIVERAFGGVESGPPEDKLGIRASNTCEVTFDSTPIPVANVLGGGVDGKEGGMAGVGQGFKVCCSVVAVLLCCWCAVCDENGPRVGLKVCGVGGRPSSSFFLLIPSSSSFLFPPSPSSSSFLLFYLLPSSSLLHPFFKVAMNILNNGRFGIGAATGAMMRKTLTACAEHASQRKQFGNPLSSYGLIQEKFATIASDTYANESLAYVDGVVTTSSTYKYLSMNLGSCAN